MDLTARRTPLLVLTCGARTSRNHGFLVVASPAFAAQLTRSSLHAGRQSSFDALRSRPERPPRPERRGRTQPLGKIFEGMVLGFAKPFRIPGLWCEYRARQLRGG